MTTAESKTEIRTESHLRSVLKGVTWRIVATSTTMIITYWYTGKIDTALMVGGTEFLLKIGIYYLHERAWQMAPRGSIRKMFKTKK